MTGTIVVDCPWRLSDELCGTSNMFAWHISSSVHSLCSTIMNVQADFCQRTDTEITKCLTRDFFCRDTFEQNVPQEYHLSCSVLLLQVAPNYLSLWLHHINTQNTDRKVDFLFHLLSCFEYSSLYKIAVNSGQAIQPILELRIGNKVKFCKPNFTTRPFKKSRFATIIFINFKRKLKGRLGYSVTNKSIFHIVG
jgi:hypothetical protein